MRRVCVALLLGLSSLASAEDAPFKDELLDKLTGEWRAAGTVRGQPGVQAVSVAWVLNHQFLQLHFVEAADPKKKEPPYEALVYLGFDNLSERYVAHWIDGFGGRFSETLGYGARSPNAVKLVFEYPDGPFHTTFAFEAAAGRWTIQMRQKDKSGAWADFASYVLERPAGKPRK